MATTLEVFSAQPENSEDQKVGAIEGVTLDKSKDYVVPVWCSNCTFGRTGGTRMVATELKGKEADLTGIECPNCLVTGKIERVS